MVGQFGRWQADITAIVGGVAVNKIFEIAEGTPLNVFFHGWLVFVVWVGSVPDLRILPL
jgi:hypothetical protein